MDGIGSLGLLHPGLDQFTLQLPACLIVSSSPQLEANDPLGEEDVPVLSAVGMVIPPIYRPEYDLAVDGLKRAARLQQQAGQEVAGKVALSVIGASLFAAGVVALGRSAA